MPSLPTNVRPFRVALRGSVSAADACLLVRGDERPFALPGAWAGGGALVGSEPRGGGTRGRGSLRAARPPAGRGGRRPGRGRRRLVRISRLPPRRPPRAHPARAAPPLRATGLRARLLRPPPAPGQPRAVVVRGALERRSRRCPQTPPGAVARPSRARRDTGAGVGGHARALAAGHRRAPRGRGGVSRADRRGRDLPGQHLPAPRGALVGRPARPLRPHHASARAAPCGAGRRTVGSVVQRIPRALPAPPRPPRADRADQGHGAARERSRGGALAIRQGPRGERDDRRPDAQRPRQGLRVRQRRGAGPDRAARGARRLAPGLNRHGNAAAGRGRRRAPAGRPFRPARSPAPRRSAPCA